MNSVRIAPASKKNAWDVGYDGVKLRGFSVGRSLRGREENPVGKRSCVKKTFHSAAKRLSSKVEIERARKTLLRGGSNKAMLAEEGSLKNQPEIARKKNGRRLSPPILLSKAVNRRQKPNRVYYRRKKIRIRKRRVGGKVGLADSGKKTMNHGRE